MPKKQITREQHYVPRFYLKGFANDDGKLAIFDCVNERMEKPRFHGAVCFEDFFYGSSTGTEDELSQVVEDAFQKVETAISAQLSSIVHKIENYQAITTEDRLMVATLMSMLWLRGPTMRNQLNGMNEHMTKELMARSISHKPLSSLVKEMEVATGQTLSEQEVEEMRELILSKEYSVSFGNAVHIRFQSEIEGFRNLFYGKKWNVYLARGRYKFITTDNPVAEYHTETNHFWGNDFLSRTHLFPLTPSILIEAVYPHHETGKKLRRKTLYDGITEQATLLSYNFSLANKANRFAYAARPCELEQLLESVHMFKTAVKMSETSDSSTV